MTQDSPPTVTRPLSWREKIGYGVSDAGFNFYSTGIATYLMIFYTDVFGITAAAAGSVMSLTKIFSMASTPLIGATADRTRTRYGKFRPYLIWLAIPLAIATVLTFTTPNLDDNAKLAYAYGTYFLMLMCYTGMNIPYNALSGVMTNIPQERTSINSLRFICAFSGSTLLTAATPFLVKWLGQGDDRLGWQLAMAAWGVVATGLFVTTFLNTRERVAPLQTKNSNVLVDLKDLSTNLPWLMLFLLALFTMVTTTLRAGSSAYYFKYYVERPDLVAAFIPCYMAAAAAGAALAPVMARFVERRRLLMILMTATCLLSSAFFFVPKDQVAVMFALQIAIGLALGPKAPLTFAMFADTADYNEWRTGRRATAMTFAAATFSGKLAIAIGSAIMGAVLTAFGYIANVQQTEVSQSGIVLLISFIPAVFAFLAFVAAIFYKLDDNTMLKVRAELVERAKKAENASTIKSD